MDFAVAVTAALLAPAAALAVQPVTYDFTGTVTSSQGGPPVGTKLPVSVTVDRDFPGTPNPSQPREEMVYAGGPCQYPNTASPILAASIGGQSALGCFDTIDIRRNVNGQSLIQIGTYSTQSGPTLVLTFASTIRGAVPNLRLPNHLRASRFMTARFLTSRNVTYQYSGTLK